MANKNRKEPLRKVYNRKILRSILKHSMGTNKIKQAWHALRAEGRI